MVQYTVPLTISIINLVAMKIFVALSKFEKETNIGLENLLVFEYVFIRQLNVMEEKRDEKLAPFLHVLHE